MTRISRSSTELSNACQQIDRPSLAQQSRCFSSHIRFLRDSLRWRI